MNYSKKFYKDKKTVKITFNNEAYFSGIEEEQMIETKEFNVVDIEDIYDRIERDEPINLQNSYVKNFSLKEYRKKKGLTDFTRLQINELYIENSFLEPPEDGVFDFSLVDFGVISLGKTHFGDGNIIFSGSNLGSIYSYFDGVTFGDGNILFITCSFGSKDAYFDLTRFGKGDVSFESATFRGNASFWKTDFSEGNISFNHSVFKGEASFHCSNMGSNYVDFSGTEFRRGNVSFLEVSASELDLRDTRFAGNLDLRVKDVRLLDLSNAFIGENVEMGEYRTEDGLNEFPDFSEIRLQKTRVDGTLNLDYLQSGIESKINTQKTSHNEKKEQFELLRENYRKIGDYKSYDKSYIQAMKHAIRSEAGFDIKYPFWTQIKRKIIFGFKLLFYEKIGLFGVSSSRVFISLFTVGILFTILYLPLIRNISDIDSPLLNRLLTSLFYSFSILFTLGYRHVFPTTSMKILASIEGVLGLFLIIYFTITIVRRVSR